MISLIAAVAQDRAIGKDGQLLWHLPEDMRYFRETTRGKPVIMGRKTWESLPDAFRPLPGRQNIVISRNPAYDAPGATLVGSLEEAVRLADDGEEVFVIGGADIYRQALPFAQRLYLTEVAHDFDADAFFPDYLEGDWKEISRSARKNHAGLDYAFVVYQRA
ncbi:MAG: dihydrofolate reductase [Propionivibrio sp.]